MSEVLARAGAEAPRTESKSSRQRGDTGERALVVVPCLNEAAYIGALLQQILSDRGATPFDVVVVDGGSSDGAQEVVRRIAASDPRVRLTHNPQRLQAAGVNLAVERFAAGADWLVRIDAHGALPPDFVSRLVEEARRTGADAVVVPMRAEGLDCFQIAAATAQNSLLGNGGAVHRGKAGGGWVDHGHHALMRTEAFRRLGGYDTRLAVNEDIDFDWRLAESGGRIWLSGDLAVTYFPRRTPASLFRQYFRFGAARLHTIRRRGRSLAPRQWLLVMLAPAGAAAALAPIWPAAAVPALAWALAACGLGLALGVRARRPCALLAGPVAMIMHMAWSLGFWRELLRPGPASLSRNAPRPETNSAA